MVEAVGAERITSVFCDSLEVYAADWTPGLADLFAARRGYRPEPKLWLLASEHTEAAAFRSDFYRTLSELYEENFLVPMADWAHERGLKLRVQSYGEPPAALSSYRHVDLVEGEQWGWTGLPMTKWASSAASHLGVGVVSSETWTWVHAPSFRATPLDLKGEAYQHALSGINQFIGHGWPCRSSAMAEGLGWLFYASGAFDDRNAWWPAMPSLMRDLQRLSWVLRQGTPVRDVLLYLPTDDAYAAFGPSIDLFTVSTGLIPPEVPRALREGGYDYDLVDDYFLAQLPPDGAPVVLVPFAATLPEETRQRLAAIEAAGARVITADVTAGDGWLAEVSAACPPDVTVSPRPDDVGAAHRRLGEADVWFVANTGPHPREVTVRPATERATYERWDLAHGTTHLVEVHDSIELSLAPYEAAVLVGHDEPAESGEVGATAHTPAETEVPLDVWRLESAEGEDLGSIELPHRWEDDPRIGPAFSGTVSYRCTVPAEGPPAARWLDFGPGTPDEAEIALGAMEVGVTGPGSLRPSGRSSRSWSTVSRWGSSGTRRGGSTSGTACVRAAWSSSGSATRRRMRWPLTPRSPSGRPRPSGCTAAASGCKPWTARWTGSARA